MPDTLSPRLQKALALVLEGASYAEAGRAIDVGRVYARDALTALLADRKRITLWLPDDLYIRLVSAATELEAPPYQVIEAALRLHLPDPEAAEEA